ncbi:MAG TPA: sulfatase-like hydrolase/transferase, partial [Fimbriimonadaceae bacterium]|nr:sulfatase-like hydrolase/transferase [Fimbriimonadaceae bacterium]
MSVVPVYARSTEAFIIWLILTLAVAGFGAWKWKWHQITAIFAGILVFFPISKIVYGEYFKWIENRREQSIRTQLERKVGSLPNIIYIILDGYGRTDVFENTYGFSNQWFIDGLRERNFYVAMKAHSNYCQTELSLSSSLNLQFVQNISAIKPSDIGQRPTFQSVIEGNRTMARLRQLGYQTSAITTGFPSFNFANADIKPTKQMGTSLFESTLIQSTPLALNDSVSVSLFSTRRKLLADGLAQLSGLGAPTSRPRITFAHILAPHPPFVFGPNGEEVPKTSAFGYWDGSDYLEKGWSADSYRKGYAGQATYISKQILGAIDRILRESDRPPIIIIQGDHGPKLGLSQSYLEKTNIDECFPILNAYLVPDAVKRQLYPSITPVNSFRTIFRALFGDNLPNLPDRSWYSPYGRPLEFTEVTKK